MLKRSLLIAAADGHRLLLFGPLGAGKTMAARRLVGLLPALSPGRCHSPHQGVLLLEKGSRVPAKRPAGLQEALETGAVHVTRAGRSASFAARFQLVATANPCPCGELLDRIDVPVLLEAVPAAELMRPVSAKAKAADDAERVAIPLAI